MRDCFILFNLLEKKIEQSLVACGTFVYLCLNKGGVIKALWNGCFV